MLQAFSSSPSFCKKVAPVYAVSSLVWLVVVANLASPLLGESLAAHHQDALKALTALDGVLTEVRNHCVLDAVLDSLPATAQGSDVGILDELGLVVAERLVNNLLLDVDEVAPCQVLADHGNGLVDGVNVAGFVHEALVSGAADDGLDPVGDALLACDETLGSEDTCRGVDFAGECVDSDDMLRLVVPGAVLCPVGRGHLVPGVVEGDAVAKDLHCDGRVMYVWEVSAAERQGAKVLVNHVEKRLGRAQAQINVRGVSSLRVVRRLHIVPDVSVAGTAKGLNGKNVALFHLGLVVALDDGHGLGAVDAVGENIVSCEVADTLDGVCGSVDLNLETLHGLLNNTSNLADAGVNASLADTGVGRLLDGLEEVVVLVVEGHSKGRVDNTAVDMDTEIDLHDVLLLQNHLVTGVRGVMRGAVVETKTAGETHTSLETVTLLESRVSSESTNTILNTLGDRGQGLSGLDVLLSPLAHLAMNLGSLAVIGKEVGVKVIEMALLLVGGTVVVLVLVLDLLAGRVGFVGEQLADLDSRRVALAGRVLLLLLGLSLLLFLGGSFGGGGTIGFVFGIIAAVVVAGSVGV
ncbi:hypothetical protein HG531_007675 [Fusarium graminearum]|nr:hypothetical protein HG531_007675 [Fusarium graminearum]